MIILWKALPRAPILKTFVKASDSVTLKIPLMPNKAQACVCSSDKKNEGN